MGETHQTLVHYVPSSCHTTALMSCTNTVRVASPCHPRFPLALTRNRPPRSTTAKHSSASAFSSVTRTHTHTHTHRPLTHLRYDPSVVPRDDLELHTSLGLPLPSLRRVPQSDVVVRRAAKNASPSEPASAVSVLASPRHEPNKLSPTRNIPVRQGKQTHFPRQPTDPAQPPF